MSSYHMPAHRSLPEQMKNPGRTNKSGLFHSSSRHNFFEFSNEIAKSFGFRPEQIPVIAFPTRTSSSISDFCAVIFPTNIAGLVGDMQILSISLDAHCRSVDAVSDSQCRNERLSSNLQFTTLLLLKSSYRVQQHHGVDVLPRLYNYMGRASYAERTLIGIHDYDAWTLNGSTNLLGEKNASLLAVPTTFNDLSASPWPIERCERLFLGLFTAVQKLDDVIDLEEDLRVGRYTHFQAYLQENTFTIPELQSSQLIRYSVKYSLGVLEELQLLLAEVTPHSGGMAAVSETIGDAIDRVRTLKPVQSHEEFIVQLRDLVPPILCYD